MSAVETALSDADDLVGTIERIKPNTGVAHEPTELARQRVMAWVSAGIPQDAMAELLMISHPTLRKHYAFELENGRNLANGMIAGTLFQKALAGDTASLIFWCKTRMGWREVERDVNVNVNAQPVDARALARELRDAVMELRTVVPLPAP